MLLECEDDGEKASGVEIDPEDDDEVDDDGVTTVSGSELQRRMVSSIIAKVKRKGSRIYKENGRIAACRR